LHPIFCRNLLSGNDKSGVSKGCDIKKEHTINYQKDSTLPVELLERITKQGRRTRALRIILYLYFDTCVEKMRVKGQILEVAVSLASSMGPGGTHRIFGVPISVSEREINYLDFREGLIF
jgi:hypothetical protein